MQWAKTLIIATAIIGSSLYLYTRGLKDGEQNYKHSRRMYFALKSAYHYGYMDAKSGAPESWDGPELHSH